MQVPRFVLLYRRITLLRESTIRFRFGFRFVVRATVVNCRSLLVGVHHQTIVRENATLLGRVG